MDTIKHFIDFLCPLNWGVISGIIVALIGFILANKRIKKNVLSNQKLKMVEGLIDSISSFEAAIDQYYTAHYNNSNIAMITASKGEYAKLHGDDNDYDFMNHGYMPYVKASREFIKCSSKLELSLKDDEALHIKLLDLIKEYKKEFDLAEEETKLARSIAFTKFCKENKNRLRAESKRIIKEEEGEVHKILQFFSKGSK